MMNRGEIRAFRAQLSLPAQVELFDYWISLSKSGALPAREDLSPADIPGLLPNICLLDVLPAPDYFRVRLAGTALRDIYGREITGETLAGSGWEASRDYWRRSIELVTGEDKPAAGMLRAPSQGKDHLVQFWLRLPLRGPRPDGRMILGLDICQTISAVDESLLGGNDGQCLTLSR